MHRSILISSLVLLSTFNCQSQDYQGDQKDIDQILKNIETFSTSYMNADYERLANSYSINGKILPPGADIIQGRQAIKKRWTLPEGVVILNHKVTPIEIKVVGEYAYDVGYYEGRTRRRDETEVSWKGKYLIVWISEEGDWKIYADAWNQIN
ncbi:MAG: nuclear transport factor 2 family protein [Cyclobacteriaceae bacterium]